MDDNGHVSSVAASTSEGRGIYLQPAQVFGPSSSHRAETVDHARFPAFNNT